MTATFEKAVLREPRKIHRTGREPRLEVLLMAVNRALHSKLGALLLRGNFAWKVASWARPLAMVATGGTTSHESFYGAAAAKAEKLVPYLRPESRVLDLGCGLGRFEKFLAPYCARITGLDPIPGFVRSASYENKHLPNVEFRVSNGTDLSGVPDTSVDFLFSFGVFERLAKDLVRGYVGETSRVLATGGRTYLEFLAEAGPGFFSEDGTWWDASVYTFWSPEEVRGLIEAADLAIESMEANRHVLTVVAKKA